uniref:Uncharacterized protein n=1 Tax=Anopheles merus TaxID=30066 RepID=A0A182VKF7_ANOME
MAFKFLAVVAFLAVASAQHYDPHHYQPQYHQYHHEPAVVKTIQPALIKTVQPALVKTSGLDSLEQRWLLVNYLLWLVLVVFGLMMVLWLLVLLIVLGAGHSDNSEQSDVLKRVNNNETTAMLE